MTWLLVVFLLASDGRLDVALYDFERRSDCEQWRPTIVARFGDSLVASRCVLGDTI